MKLLSRLVLSAHAALTFWVWQTSWIWQTSPCDGDICYQGTGATVAMWAVPLLVPVSIVAALTLVVIWARERDGNA